MRTACELVLRNWGLQAPLCLGLQRHATSPLGVRLVAALLGICAKVSVWAVYRLHFSTCAGFEPATSWASLHERRARAEHFTNYTTQQSASIKDRYGIMQCDQHDLWVPLRGQQEGSGLSGRKYLPSFPRHHTSSLVIALVLNFPRHQTSSSEPNFEP